MKKNKIKIILSICLIICGLTMTILFSTLSNRYDRPDETYYHYNEGNFGYGYIEIKTSKKIDVDNCFVYLESSYSTNKELLDYQGYNKGYYCFKYYKHDYIFIDVEIHDEASTIIELTKYSEIEEMERQKPISKMLIFEVIGVVLIIVGILILVQCVVKLKFKKNENKIKEENQAVQITNDIEKSSLIETISKNSNKDTITCKYCNSQNYKDSLKCANCGAVLNSKKSR